MKKTEKRNYEAPALTVVHYKTERGYFGSGVTAVYLSLLTSGEGGNQALESRIDNNATWGDGSWY